MDKKSCILYIPEFDHRQRAWLQCLIFVHQFCFHPVVLSNFLQLFSADLLKYLSRYLRNLKYPIDSKVIVRASRVHGTMHVSNLTQSIFETDYLKGILWGLRHAYEFRLQLLSGMRVIPVYYQGTTHTQLYTTYLRHWQPQGHSSRATLILSFYLASISQLERLFLILQPIE